MGIEGWTKEFDIPVYIYKDEAAILRDPALNLSSMFGTSYAYEKVTCLSDGEKLVLAGYTFEVIHTPGHTSGGCCYYVKMRKCCLAEIHCFAEALVEATSRPEAHQFW